MPVEEEALYEAAKDLLVPKDERSAPLPFGITLEDIPAAMSVLEKRPDLRDQLTILCSNQVAASSVGTYNWIVKVRN